VTRAAEGAVSAAVLLLSSAFGPAARAAETKLAVVDFRRALAETEEGRQATAQLKRLFEGKQKELTASESDLKKAADDLDRRRSLLSPDAVRQKEAELAKRLQALREVYERHQAEVGRKQAELLGALQARMQKIVAAIATTENLSMVLDRSQLLFAKPHLDITNELIRRFEAEKPAAKPGKAPALPQKKD
jgi:outer membrane protein